MWENLLDGSTRGVWSLTPLGYKTSLDTSAGHKVFLKWVKVHASARKKIEEVRSEGAVPTEVEVVADTDHKFLLLELLKKVTPEGFERICARLLRESGFEKVTVTGGPKDEGEKLVEMFERVNLGLNQRVVYELDHAFFADFLPSDG